MNELSREAPPGAFDTPKAPREGQKTLVIHASDGVCVALVELAAGETVEAGDAQLAVVERIPAGHKVALRAHAAGEHVTKYGYPIGRATRAIAKGEHVHSHNLETRLTPEADVDYLPTKTAEARVIERSWQGYL